MAPSEEKEDQAVLSTVYTTVSYCLHREEGDKEETKKECAKETWRLQREIPLFVSEDGNSRLNLMVVGPRSHCVFTVPRRATSAWSWW